MTLSVSLKKGRHCHWDARIGAAFLPVAFLVGQPQCGDDLVESVFFKLHRNTPCAIYVALISTAFNGLFRNLGRPLNL